MFSGRFILFLLLGTLFMMIPICIQTKWYGLRWWKSILIAFVLTVCGTLGTYLWFFAENFRIGGRSFYGAVFLVPVLFILVSFLFRIPYGNLMDLCAPAECMMLVLMKILCSVEGCCVGRVLWINQNGTALIFPSQIAESINALLLCLILMILSYRKNNQGMIYPWYLVLYGTTRFTLNFFREEWVTTRHFVPLGTIWSVLAFIIGIGILLFYKKRKSTVIS